jgi:zinc-ribbon domain
VCPSCGREHDADERFCSDCGMPLVHLGGEHDEPARDEAHERARKIRPELTRGPLVRVAGGRHQAEAELIQNILLEEGVPSILRRTAGFDVPDFLAAGPRDVMVPESGLTVAREALHAEGIAPAPVLAGFDRAQALRIAAAVAGGSALAALIAWGLIQLGG